MLDAVTTQAAAAFAVALLGGVHCAGMCGGIVGALQMHRTPTLSARALAIGYHAGRLTSYTLAGLLAGLLGGALYASDVRVVQVALLLSGSLMLVFVGASMLGKRTWLRRLEPVGARLWKVVAPLARRVFPPRTRLQAGCAGFLWGWIPCGMVYAALPLALTAGSAAGGAVVMLVFGLGTLPAMLAVDVVAFSVGRAGAHPSLRAWLAPCAGAVIVLFGLSGLAHAATVAGARNPALVLVASICHR